MNDRRITFIKDMDRRSMIRMGLISAASVLINGKALALRRMIPSPSAAPESIPQEIIVPKIIKPEERKICIYNLHTKEHQETIYWRNGEYIESALIDLDFIFRDHYNGSVKKMDRRLLDFLFAIQQKGWDR